MTIIAIISAIAIRRVSRYSDQTSANAAAQDISVMQLGIERYRAEHGNYPSASNVADQLTQFTDGFGNVSATRVAPYIYGPYIRAVPPVPAGPAMGRTKIAAAAASDVGWLYDVTSGAISVNDTP